MQLTIDVEVDFTDHQSPVGAVRTATGESRPFTGWLELLALMHELLLPPAQS